MLRAAAAAAAVLAALASAPAAAQAPGPAPLARGSFDPAAFGRTLATTRTDAAGTPTVLVRTPGGPSADFPDARSPALDADLLAYVDAAGIRIVRWTTGEEIGRIDGPLDKPAVDWPLVAYVRHGPAGQALELLNMVTGVRRQIVRAGREADLGRPALRDGLLAWHRAVGRDSQLRLRPVGARRGSRLIASSVTGLQVNPSISSGRILWVEHFGSTSSLRLRRIAGGPVRTLLTVRGPAAILWSTAMGARTAFVTRWSPATARGRVIARAWRR